jgi:serine protease AprX
MRIFLFLLLFTLPLYSQINLNKVSPLINYQIQNGDDLLVWIFFTDKGEKLNKYYSLPEEVVSPKSLQRRSKVLPKNSLISFEDIPLNQTYIDQIESSGIKIKQKSRWLNAVSCYINRNDLRIISAMEFVKSIDIVYTMKKADPVEVEETSIEKTSQPEGVYSFNYGNSFTQNNQINVPAVHNLGITGSGITIGVFDAGFNRLSHESFNTMNIIATWDFVNGDPDVGDGGLGSGTHGTQTLSTIGGFKEGSLIGPAFAANYILAKTENTLSETPIEEDNWIAALEWADSIGVDVTSTSLGYITFDPPFVSYTWQSMNGNTCRITIAADLAVKRGIVVLNSAGNEGFNATRNTLGAPADGDSVIAVGAVTSLGVRSSFSSVGNTVDGRIKPDIMAMGSSVRVASTSNNTLYSTASGTSFSCPLAAGVAALVLNANPSLTPMQVRDALRNTASRSSNPDRENGWGIINALAAIQYFPVPVELVSFSAFVSANTINLSWTTASETNNQGFEIERNNRVIGFVAGTGNSTIFQNYSFIDKHPVPGISRYRIKQIDYDGSFKYYEEIEVDYHNYSYSLSQNYPNPFNPSTKITYSVSEKSHTNIKIYDMLGNEIITLVNDVKTPGVYSVEFNAGILGKTLSSGVYICRMSAGNFNRSTKMILLR